VGVDYPATAQRNGQVILLDRRGLDQIGSPANPRAALWQEGYEKASAMLRAPQIGAHAATRPVVSASAQASATVRASVEVPAGAIVYPTWAKTQNGKIAFLLKSGYTYRQIERELSVSHATISTVNKAVALQAQQNTPKTS
jgi:hypothetical protein